MLNTCTAIVVHIFLNLRFLLAIGRLVDGHLDSLLVVGHNNGTQRRVLGVYLRIVYRPETMELQDTLVPGSNALHLQIRLVTHHMIDKVKLGQRQILQQHILCAALVARQEVTRIAVTLYKSVSSIAVLTKDFDLY